MYAEAKPLPELLKRTSDAPSVIPECSKPDSIGRVTAERQQPTFEELGVAAELCDALREAGIDRTFAIQELTLPIALDGRDLIGQARTGMGKTYGFGIPLLDRVFDAADVAELDGTPRALVVAPTRELASQVSEDLTKAATYTPVRITTIYGGRPFEEQIKALERGVDVVVGTPGRLLDLHKRGHLDLSQVAILVLDEADEMLDLGFFPDIEKLLEALTHQHQTMLFSATMPGPVLTLARTFLDKPVHIRAEEVGASQTHSSTKQVVFQAHRMNKDDITARILQADGRGKTIIFCRTKRSTAQLAEDLAQRGFRVAGVHGDLGQGAREQSLKAFREGRVEILVATDVAARGIDVDDVTHVINYQTPDDPMTYVHRIGRTGRAGHSGTAVTLVGYDELAKWQAINDELGLDTPEPPQWFSTSPELFQALDIPEDAKDRIGAPKRSLGGGTTALRGQGKRRDSQRGGRDGQRGGRDSQRGGARSKARRSRTTKRS
ncbi:DEAD-box ATP-dependent RNA helicase CshA [Corynebacterium pelargi]|uniref:DEAD-box ATP-dependent RNA helicase CshA n=1 Tax=Corynebacterium pelargi TaxID=1471400 RepID=A0A410WAA5_9CORY|nr:DEAD-box ATP-dependent RNA helicase CshA [Corynebacterium pelargi]